MSLDYGRIINKERLLFLSAFCPDKISWIAWIKNYNMNITRNFWNACFQRRIIIFILSKEQGVFIRMTWIIENKFRSFCILPVFLYQCGDVFHCVVNIILCRIKQKNTVWFSDFCHGVLKGSCICSSIQKLSVVSANIWSNINCIAFNGRSVGIFFWWKSNTRCHC